MYTSRKKIHKDKDAETTEFKETVAHALFDLENTNQDFKTELQDLFINSAVQMDVSGNRKAVVIYVPYRLRKAFCKVHLRLVRELEKKFSGKDVVVLATKRILRPPKKGSAVQRPRTQTLTAVHEAMLKDIVDPDEIEEEQCERDRKNKINMDFQNFVNQVNDLWGQPQFKALDLEFDQPMRELGFHGIPHKASAFIVPTSNCLVELIETPFVVITLSEIEILNLERVGLG
ncbi:hypothetical protein REPUB_Repub18cG0039600 [Reevesia pubescens]